MRNANRTTLSSISLLIFRYYDKIKYQQMIYEKGDWIEIYNMDDPKSSLVAKLTKIIRVPDTQ